MHTRQRDQRFLVALIVLALWIGGTATVFAHARPRSSIPAASSQLMQSPAQVQIVFSEETTPAMSDGRVTNEAGEVVSTGFIVDPADRTQMRIALRPNLPNGTYTVGWRTFTGDDNGTAQGTFTFSVYGAAAATTPRTPTVVFDGPNTRVPPFTAASASVIPPTQVDGGNNGATAAPTPSATRATTASSAVGGVSATPPATLPQTGVPSASDGPPTAFWLALTAGAIIAVAGAIAVWRRAA